jgi:hypothetical protein
MPALYEGAEKIAVPIHMKALSKGKRKNVCSREYNSSDLRMPASDGCRLAADAIALALAGLKLFLPAP